VDPSSWARVEQVLDAVLTSAPSERSRLLEQRCAGDADLRREVEALLARHDRLDRFLETPPAVVAEAMEGRDAADLAGGGPAAGRRIGAYRLVRPIGRGGMARVYLAERADGAFEQQVAIKLLRADLDSPVDLARFRSERQILASLSHPNIARLLDGGVTEDGQPYLVLEYVDGQPLDRHCEAAGLGVPERLALFCAAAEAVRDAHRALVVHRDLKPSNILVTAAGQVKLLDFGLAKLLEGAGAGPSPLTGTGHRWMTPAYAAPEQILGGPITTLTDVYQLGAVLFELLAGERPFADRDSLHALEEAVLREEAPPPSSRHPSLGADLDAIVLQALRKEPERRYASVEALLDDLRRYQQGRPVRARQAGAGYRLRKFIGRNRAAVTAGSVAVLALLGGTGFSIVQMREARRQRDQATADARHAQALSTVLTVVAGNADRTAAAAGTPLQRLESAARVLERRYGGHPALVAEILADLSSRLYDIGDLAGQRRFLARAASIARTHDQPAQLALATCLAVMSYADDGLLDSARAGLEVARQAMARAGGGDATVRLECHDAEGKLRLAEGRPEEGVAAMRRALAEAERAPDQSNRDQALSMLAEALRATGNTREAARLHRRILAGLDSSGYLDADAMESMAGFVTSEMSELGELAEVDSLLAGLLRRQEEVLGPNRTTAVLGFLHGQALARLGRLDSADVWMSRVSMPSEGPLKVWLPTALVQLRLDQGRAADARAALASIPGDTPTRLVNRALASARLRRMAGDSAGATAVLDSAIRTIPPGSRPPAYFTSLLLTAAEWRLEGGTAEPAAADSLAQLGRKAAAVDSLALERSAHVARAELALARARLALGDRAGAGAAAERARIASAVGNGAAHPRTVAATALRDSLTQ
jgi:serine/threonine-protein kinase